MRCQDVQGHFSDLYDGIAVEQTALKKHLQECPTCAAEYESYSRLINELRQLPMPELPDDFHKTIMAKVRAIAPSNTDTTVKPDFELHRGKAKALPGNRMPQKSAPQRAYAATRRWASVAVAACLLLVSMWAVQNFNLVSSSGDSADFAAMPFAVYSAELESEPALTDDFAAIEMADEDDTIFELLEPAAMDMQLDDSISNRIGAYEGEQYDADSTQATTETHTQSITNIEPASFSGNSYRAMLDQQVPQTTGRSQAWTIAFATGFAILGISLAAIFWNLTRKKG